MLVDSHCHLDFPDFASEIDAVVARARAAGLTRMVTISTFVEKFPALRAIAERYDEVYCSVGTHPHNAAKEPNVTADDLVAAAKHPKVVAIGEAGLDYHYDNSPRAAQEKGFRAHIQAARETKLPLVIHAREADEDIARILEQESKRGEFPFVLHCFHRRRGACAPRRGARRLCVILGYSHVQKWRELAKNRRRLARGSHSGRDRRAVSRAPIPYRGKRNEPAYVAETARVLAETRGVNFDAIAKITSANFFRLFSKVPAV